MVDRGGAVTDRPTNSRFAGDARRSTALPLGGVGAGHMALHADGSLRQWQLHGRPNHTAFAPGALFAVRACCIEPPADVRRILQTAPPPPAADPAPCVDDDHVPNGLTDPLSVWPPVAASELSVGYPFARVAFADPELPLAVELEAHTPFVPLDDADSGLPLVVFNARLRNSGAEQLHGWLLATLPNLIGWDGLTEFRDGRCGVLGGNVNRIVRDGERTAIVMDNPTLAEDDPRFGEMAISSTAPCVPLPRFADVADALRIAQTLKLLAPSQRGDFSPAALRAAVRDHQPPPSPVGPSQGGTTWGGGLALPFALAPGEETTIEVVHAWWLPNRVADFDQFGPERGLNRHRLWLGNAYAERHRGVAQVLDHHARERDELLASSRAWAESTATATLPQPVRELLDVQASLIRSPTLMVTGDGRCYGFEGGLGASTTNWNGDWGGSCPLTCTHVYNYEQALSRLFPRLARTMREVELDHVLGADGSLPHRVVLPLWLPQLHGVEIGGPAAPALDGMLGAVLKTYREARQGGGAAWLAERWDALARLMDHVDRTWNTAGDGVLRGEQPCTYDIALHGPNLLIGGLWLAALRTMEEIALRLGRSGADTYRARFEQARDGYEQLFNGEYYAQPVTGEPHDFGDGCLSDQLLGQWWAHQLELGYLLDPERVRSSLRAIVAHNLRQGFAERTPDDPPLGYRVFADGDDRGLVVCSWPRGGRPDVPLRYCDEVWSGVEYVVAAHCIDEGLEEEGLALVEAVRRRHDGTRRNPYNEIECGDHYARAMSGWSVLEALTGFRYDALAGRIALRGRPGRFPFVAGTAWGTIAVDDAGRVELTIARGELELNVLTVVDSAGTERAHAVDRRLDARQPLVLETA
jgi:uncharacterized protein (DUF608 family)